MMDFLKAHFPILFGMPRDKSFDDSIPMTRKVQYLIPGADYDGTVFKHWGNHPEAPPRLIAVGIKNNI